MSATPSRRKSLPSVQAAPATRNVVLGVALSLDGYIARSDGSVDWLIMDPEIDFRAYTAGFDVVIAGRRTLDPSNSRGGGGMGKMACYIFSRSQAPGKRNGAEYVNRPPADLIRELRATPGKDIWLMGGGELAHEFLKEDLVDRMDLGFMPVLLGEGIPLFPRGFPQRNFTLAKFQPYTSGIVMVSYQRCRPPQTTKP